MKKRSREMQYANAVGLVKSVLDVICKMCGGEAVLKYIKNG